LTLKCYPSVFTVNEKLDDIKGVTMRSRKSKKGIQYIFQKKKEQRDKQRPSEYYIEMRRWSSTNSTKT
jgi:hypothetical protein